MANYFEVQDVFDIAGRGIILCGPVTEGQIQIGSTVFIEDKNFSVAGIEANRESKEIAVSGENVGILMKGDKADKKFFKQQVGQVLMFNG